MEFGKILYTLRKEHGLSQKKLSDELNVSQASINYWERGDRTPSIDAAKKIAEYFKISLNDLIGVEYFDAITDTKALADEVKHLEAFEKYLNSLGFSVKEDVTEWHYENPDEPDPSERVRVPDRVEYKLSKDGKSAVFTSEEYDDLEKSAKETIEGKFYKKIVQHSK